MDVNHVSNFLDAVLKDIKQNAPISDASVSTMMCHLGNISQEVGRTIHIDDKTGRVVNDDKAMTHWKREYENGWEAEFSG